MSTSLHRAILLGLALSSGVALAQAPTAGTSADEPHPFSIHDMVAMQRLSDPHVSPDGLRVVFTVRETDLEANRGRTDLWIAKTDGTGLRRLTSHPEGDSTPRWGPDGRIYFLSSRSESSQIWSIDPTGGEATQVTDLPLDVNAFEVVPQTRQLLLAMDVYVGTTPQQTAERDGELAEKKGSARIYDELLFRHWDTWEDGKRQHVFVRPLAGADGCPKAGDEALRDLIPDLDADVPTHPWGGTEEWAVSKDGKTLVFTAKVLPGSEAAWKTDTDLYAVPLDGSAPPRCLTEGNEAVDTSPAFSPDGKTLAYLAMVRPGYEADRLRIVLMDWATGKTRTLTEAWDRSPWEYVWSPDGKLLYAGADNLGHHGLFAIDAKTGKATEIVSSGTSHAFQPVQGGVYFLRNSLMGPDELHFTGSDGKGTKKLTSFNDARLAKAQMGRPEPYTFAGWNGDTVYGWTVTPANFDASKKYPVAVLVHGGPQGSFGDDFHYRWNPQAYAGAGFAVVTVDFHGSTGYGQDFTDAINGHWGDRPFEDIMKGIDAALAKYPWMDGEKLVAAGASYGGYQINWMEGHTDRFKAFVCHDGNLDERMAYYDTEELWFPEWEHGGTPWENPTGYEGENPVNHVGAWKTPMLVVHGERDYRVVYTQGLSTFTALRRRGVPAKLMVFPDENHWVLKPHNSIQWHEEVMAWLTRWVQ